MSFSTNFQVQELEKSAGKRSGLQDGYGNTGILSFARNFWMDITICMAVLSQ
jgi:hypothetical protein